MRLHDWYYSFYLQSVCFLKAPSDRIVNAIIIYKMFFFLQKLGILVIGMYVS